jgi:hypothetical protein
MYRGWSTSDISVIGQRPCCWLKGLTRRYDSNDETLPPLAVPDPTATAGEASSDEEERCECRFWGGMVSDPAEKRVTVGVVDPSALALVSSVAGFRRWKLPYTAAA